MQSIFAISLLSIVNANPVELGFVPDLAPTDVDDSEDPSVVPINPKPRIPDEITGQIAWAWGMRGNTGASIGGCNSAATFFGYTHWWSAAASFNGWTHVNEVVPPVYEAQSGNEPDSRVNKILRCRAQREYPGENYTVSSCGSFDEWNISHKEKNLRLLSLGTSDSALPIDRLNEGQPHIKIGEYNDVDDQGQFSVEMLETFQDGWTAHLPKLGYNGVMFHVEKVEGDGDLIGAFQRLFDELKSAGLVIAVSTSWCGGNLDEDLRDFFLDADSGVDIMLPKLALNGDGVKLDCGKCDAQMCCGYKCSADVWKKFFEHKYVAPIIETSSQYEDTKTFFTKYAKVGRMPDGFFEWLQPNDYGWAHKMRMLYP